MTYFKMPSCWHIPEEAFRLSMAEMAIDGRLGYEGVAMWLGSHNGDIGDVTHVAVLRGPGIRKSPDQLLISSDLMNELTDVAIELGLSLIGQIHSHGPMHGTFLSTADKRFGIAVPGYLSAVAPDYAMRSHTTMRDCGIHIFENLHGWRRLAPSEINQRILMVSDATAQVIVVGE